MIITAIAVGVLTLLLAILGFLPVVNSLPFGMDGVFYTVGHWLYLIQADFWPLAIVFQIFFDFYLPFLVILMILKFVLGHRAPGHHK